MQHDNMQYNNRQYSSRQYNIRQDSSKTVRVEVQLQLATTLQVRWQAS